MHAEIPSPQDEALAIDSYLDEVQHERRKKTRRRLGRFTAGMLSVSTLLGTVNAAETMNYNKQLTIQKLADSVSDPIYDLIDTHERDDRFEDEATLLIPGFNMSPDNSRETAKTLRKSFHSVGDMGWMGFSDTEENLDIETIGQEALRYVKDNNIKNLNLYGCSFGGMLSIELAVYLQEHDVTVSQIILDSSPAESSDVKDQDGLDWAASLFMNSLTYGMRKSYDQHGAKPMQMTKDTYMDLTAYNDDKRLSATAVKAQAKYIKGDNKVQQTADKLSLDTKLIYIGSERGDETIKVIQAYAHYQALFPNRFIEYYTSSPEGDQKPSGHASPIGDVEIYNDIFSTIVDHMEYTPTTHVPFTPQ